MIYAAQIDQRNIVVDVIVVGDEHGMEWVQANLPGQWIETSSTIRGKFAAKGDTYNATLDEFIAPAAAELMQ
jgi:hypothetical protein